MNNKFWEFFSLFFSFLFLFPKEADKVENKRATVWVDREDDKDER